MVTPFSRISLPLLVLLAVLLPGLSTGCANDPPPCPGNLCASGGIDAPACGAPPPGLIARPVPPKPLSPPSDPIALASGAGALPGGGAVTPTGEYQYRIPIDVPPGRAGMQPSLAIAYSSRGKNDQLGVGFQLEGFSAITRCPTTFATEGRADGVHLDAHDALCLDGHKLVRIDASHERYVTEYRTEDETFARIIGYGDREHWIGRFRVWTKEGRIRDYQAVDLPAVWNLPLVHFAWPLAEEADRAGNSIRYSYDIETEYGDNSNDPRPRIEYHPKQIEYTRSTSAGQLVDPGRRRISFTWEARPDPGSVYVGGALVSNHKRLSTIDLSYLASPSSVVSTGHYELTYTTSDTSGASLLGSVRRCGSQGGCLLAKRFHWQSTGGPSFQSIPIEGLPNDGIAPITLDVDGDGTDEILSLAEGIGYTLRRTLDPAFPLGERIDLAPEALFPGFDEAQLDHGFPVDLDGDGADEILAPVGADDPAERGYYLFRYDAIAKTFWRAPGPPLEPTLHNPHPGAPFEEPVTIADLDGDGLPDLIKAEPPDESVPHDVWHWFYRHNLGGTFGPKVPLDIPGAPMQSAETGATFLFPLDIAGDYRASVLVTARYPFNEKEPDALFGFRLDRNGNPEKVGTQATFSYHASLYADMNGDGLRDRVIGGSNYVLVALSNGQTGGDDILLESSPVFATIPFNVATDKLLAADLDGDGREDILVFHRNELGMDELTVLRLGAAQTLEATPFGLHPRAQLGDFDGDGRIDLATWANGLFTVDRGTGETSDRIDAVNDAFDPNPREQITYRSDPLPLEYPCDFPQRRITHGFTVVGEHRVFQGEDVVTDGAKEQRRVYHYRGPRIDVHGRGFLGFSTVEAWDPGRLAETVTTYDNRTADGTIYPYAFLPKTIERTVVIDGSSKRARLTRTELGSQVDHLNGGKTYFVHPSAWTSLEWEEDVTVDPSEAVERHLGGIDGADEHTALRVQHGSSTYDGFGNVTAQEVSTVHGVTSRATSTYEIREADWLISLVESQATTSGDPSAVPAPQARHVAYQYDARGLVCHVHLEKDDPDPSIPEVLTYSRDGEGLVIAVTASAIGAPSRTTHFSSDVEERVHRTQIWNDLGHSQWFLHDPALGVVLAAEDTNGVRVASRYDDLGRVVGVLPEGGDPSTFSYDPRLSDAGTIVGLSVLTTRGSGAQARVDFDELGRPIGQGHVGFDKTWIERATRYDLLGRTVFHSRPGFGEPSKVGVHSRYDHLDRLIEEKRPGNAITTVGQSFLETHTTDPMGHQAHVVRDLDGRTVKSVQIHGGKELATTFQYGNFGQLAWVTDPAGNTITSGYDRRGRRWFSDDPDAGMALFTYNGFGDLTGKVLDGVAATTYTFDAIGRVIQTDDDDGTTLTTWDTSPHGIGRIGHTKSPDGIIQDFAFDDLGRSVGQTWTIEGLPFTVGVSYDAAGRPSTLTYPAVPGKPAFAVGRHYAVTGTLDSVYDASSPDQEFWHGSAWNEDDRLLQGTLGNGVEEARTYDDDTGRLTSLTDGDALSLVYTYDFDGSIQHKRDALAQRIETYAYDELHRLGSWTLSTIVPGAPGFPESTPTLHQTTYAYDDLGNLTGSARDGALEAHNVYGEDGRPHALTSDAKGAYHYDGRGRQFETPIRSMTFTERNLPRTIDTAAGQTRFSYDATGQRVTKEGPTESVITLGGLYERRTSGAAVHHVFTVAGGEGPVAQVTYDEGAGTRATEYLHRDPQGSVGAITDQAGKVVRALYYEPFGKRRDKDGEAAKGPDGEGEVGYTGQRHDDDLGLIDMKGRIYDPSIRRFLTPDPYVPAPLFGQSYNRYSYVFNNPVNLTDPSGFFPDDDGGMAGCGIDRTCSDPIEIAFTIGGQSGDPSGGGSARRYPSGGPVVTADQRRPASLPTGTSVPGGTRSGPQTPTWADHPAAQLTIGTAQGLGMFGFGVGKTLVLNAVTFGGYTAYGFADNAWEGYKQDGAAGAVNGVNPLYHLGKTGADGYLAASKGDYSALGRVLGGLAGQTMLASVLGAAAGVEGEVAAGATAGELEAAEAGGMGFTRLFRAVEGDELKDVLKFGDYNIHPNSTFKRFAFGEGDLDAFIRANPGRSYTKTFVDIPTDKLQFMFEHPDPGGVGRAVGVDVFELPQFYDWFKGPVQVVP